MEVEGGHYEISREFYLSVPESATTIRRLVDAIYEREDHRIFLILHKIANRAMKGTTYE